jgi:hypothetical protein
VTPEDWMRQIVRAYGRFPVDQTPTERIGILRRLASSIPWSMRRMTEDKMVVLRHTSSPPNSSVSMATHFCAATPGAGRQQPRDDEE